MHRLKIKPIPLPKISDLLRKLAGFKYATVSGLGMGVLSHSFKFESQKYFSTILPWG
jgi:hypothetical protein